MQSCVLEEGRSEISLCRCGSKAEISTVLSGTSCSVVSTHSFSPVTVSDLLCLVNCGSLFNCGT